MKFIWMIALPIMLTATQSLRCSTDPLPTPDSTISEEYQLIGATYPYEYTLEGATTLLVATESTATVGDASKALSGVGPLTIGDISGNYSGELILKSIKTYSGGTNIVSGQLTIDQSAPIGDTVNAGTFTISEGAILKSNMDLGTVKLIGGGAVVFDGTITISTLVCEPIMLLPPGEN
jgi:hypothetical protein